MTEVAGVAVDEGADLFARFAFAPNALGYCGPPDAAALRDGTAEQVRGVARGFSGAWPYLRVMARMSGIADPLDPRLVRSYWLGGGVGARLDGEKFTLELLALIGPVAGQYWRHLTGGLAAEAAANHCFHVFGVYPWTRLLGVGTGAQPLRVLDGCRIGWGTVRARRDTALTVDTAQLCWDGGALSLSEPRPRHVLLESGGRLAVDAEVGDTVAIHWDRVCATLDPDRIADLAAATDRQLTVTNRRLASG